MRPLLAPLLLAAALAGCLGAPADLAPTPEGNATPTTTAPAVAPMTATIELGESGSAPVGPSMGPGSMYLKATGMDALVVGVPVSVNVTNKGGMTHNVVIEGTDFKSGDLAPGKSVTVTWTPAKDGTFAMYCDIGFNDPAGANVANHRGAGMEGTATVKKA